MHMMSKKELGSNDLDTLRRSRNPTVVLIAYGVVSHEEAQVFVHDLNLFVTAVPSLGKLFEDHGYPNEWVSAQNSRLTKEEKRIICKTDNFLRLVVPGLSVNSASSSSPTSLPRESLRTEADQASGNSASSSSSSSVFERSDETTPRKCKPKTKIKRGMTVEIRTTVCEIFRSGWRSSQII